LDYFLRKGFSDWVQSWFSRVQRFFSRSVEERNDLVRRRLGGSVVQTNGALSAHHPPVAGTEDEGDLAWKDYDRHMREHFDTVNEAVKCYIPQPYAGQIVLFRSSVGYRRAEMRIADSKMGWGRIAKGGLQMFVVPGNHLQIIREPNVKHLGEPLRACLDQVQQSLGEQLGNKSV